MEVSIRDVDTQNTYTGPVYLEIHVSFHVKFQTRRFGCVIHLHLKENQNTLRLPPLCVARRANIARSISGSATDGGSGVYKDTARKCHVLPTNLRNPALRLGCS